MVCVGSIVCVVCLVPLSFSLLYAEFGCVMVVAVVVVVVALRYISSGPVSRERRLMCRCVAAGVLAARCAFAAGR